jgi:NADPH-dependent curcumin reductase CurA
MSATFVPSHSLPTRNRRVLLARRPLGIPEPDDFAFDEAPLPTVDDRQFLVRNIYLSVDPAQRGWACDGTNYAPPVPIGSVMRALAVGMIIESRHDDFPTGSFVYGWLGWQDYAAIGPAQVLTHFTTPCVPLSAYAGVLGINGMTAYLALNDLGRPAPGETVLVSTAAGAVGSLVGQLAHAVGCKTIGLTSDDLKVARCLARHGYDVAINYKSAPIADLLNQRVPDGVDVFFDNVGGPILDAALRCMRTSGRVIQCGTASISSWSPPPSGIRNEREVLMRRLVWSGFVIFDHLQRFEAVIGILAGKINDGSLVYDEDISVGIEYAGVAIRSLYAGENSGKKLIFIG